MARRRLRMDNLTGREQAFIGDSFIGLTLTSDPTTAVSGTTMTDILVSESNIFPRSNLLSSRSMLCSLLGMTLFNLPPPHTHITTKIDTYFPQFLKSAHIQSFSILFMQRRLLELIARLTRSLNFLHTTPAQTSSKSSSHWHCHRPQMFLITKGTLVYEFLSPILSPSTPRPHFTSNQISVSVLPPYASPEVYGSKSSPVFSFDVSLMLKGIRHSEA